MKIYLLASYFVLSCLLFVFEKQNGYNGPLILLVSKLAGPALLPAISFSVFATNSYQLIVFLNLFWITPVVLLFVKLDLKVKVSAIIVSWLVGSMVGHICMVLDSV